MLDNLDANLDGYLWLFLMEYVGAYKFWVTLVYFSY